MRKILILLVGMICCNLISGQTLMISDAVTGIAFKPSDNVTFTRTISYSKIFKYEQVFVDPQFVGGNVGRSYPDRPNCITESFKYYGPEYVYKFSSGDTELENKSPNGNMDFKFVKRIIISVSAPGYEKGTIISSYKNFYTGGTSNSKSYGHIELVPIKGAN